MFTLYCVLIIHSLSVYPSVYVFRTNTAVHTTGVRWPSFQN